MVIHFENKAQAEAHLKANGWKPAFRLGQGVYASKDGRCGARIDSLPNTPVVQLYAWEF